MKKIIKNKIILAALVAIVFPFVSYADTYSYGSGDFYSYDDSYSSGDYYGYDNSYGSGDYYDYNDSYSSGDYYSYDDTYGYSSGDYYGYDDFYGSGDYYSYEDVYSSGDYYSYEDTYSSGDYYSYEDIDYSCSDCFGDLAYNQDYYSYYQDYDDYGYYEDDYYYDDDYYGGGGGCTSNCGGGYNPPPQYDDLDVICTVSDRTLEKGDSVTFTADVDGGRGSYTYRWSQDVSGSSRSITQRFNREGTYRATVRVTDRDGQTATANCATVVVEEDRDEDFDAVCKVSDSSIEEGDTVRFTAEVDGGDTPYDYDWSGDVSEDERTFTKRFNKSGTYEIDLRVTDDDGRVARDTCTVRVKDEKDNDDRDITVTSGTLSSGRGNLAGVSSVYLNQVPYTGPEDTAKGIAFVVGILAWSIAGALIIRNKMSKKSVSNRIEAFKNANRTTVA